MKLKKIHLVKPSLPALSSLAALLVSAAIPLTSHAAPRTWNGSASVGWTNTSNWNEGAVPGNGDDVIFGDTATMTNNATSNGPAATSASGLSSLQFRNQGSYTISIAGNVIFLGGGLTSNRTGTVTIGNNIRVVGNGTSIWNISAGSTVQLSNGLLNDGVGGSSNFEKTGAGTLFLTGTSSDIGGTGRTFTITEGSVSTASNTNIGSLNSTLVLNGGTYLARTTHTQSRVTNVTAGSRIEVAAAQTLTSSGNISLGTNTITKTGSGIWEINTATGSTSSAGSKLVIEDGRVNLQRANSLGLNAAIEIGGSTAATTATLSFRDQTTAHGNNITVSSTGATTKELVFMNPTAGSTATASGTILLNDNLSVVVGSGGNGSITGNISGIGGLTKTGANRLTLAGNNTFSGNTIVNGGSLVLADNAKLTFNIGTTGVNNGITGNSTLLLDGDFVFDLTSAGTTVGDSWSIVNVATLTETFGSTFSVDLFSRVGGGTGAGVWNRTFNGADYQFDTSTGMLTVVPEPSTAALLGLGVAGLALLRRRKTQN